MKSNSRRPIPELPSRRFAPKSRCSRVQQGFGRAKKIGGRSGRRALPGNSGRDIKKGDHAYLAVTGPSG